MRSALRFAGLLAGFGLAVLAPAVSAQVVQRQTLTAVHSAPAEIASAPNGDLWIALNHQRFLVKVAAGTDEVTLVEVAPPLAGLFGVAVAHDGSIYFSMQKKNRLGALGPDGVVRTFDLPTPDSQPTVLLEGPDGDIWYCGFGANLVGRLTPSTGAIRQYHLPTAGGFPRGLAFGTDGGMWVAVGGEANNITRIDPATGVVAEHLIPSLDVQPYRIVAGPDGALWFTELWGNRVGRITMDGAIREFPIPTSNAGARGITVGPDGALWFLEGASRKVARITTAGAISEITVPSELEELHTDYFMPPPPGFLMGIATRPDGTLWFTDAMWTKVGRVQLGLSAMSTDQGAEGVLAAH